MDSNNAETPDNRGETPLTHYANDTIYEHDNTKILVRKVLCLVIEHSGINSLSHINEESSNSISHTLYLWKTVIPTLIPGLITLLSAKEHYKKSLKGPLGVRLIHDRPLDYLAQYLIRHNPRYADGNSSYDSKDDSVMSVESTDMQSLIVEATEEVIAEILTAEKAKNRRKVWESKDQTKMMTLWKRFCPNKGDELLIEHVEEALDQFAELLGVHKENFLDAKYLFSLMDVDGSSTVSFVEFEDVLGKYLYEAERFSDHLHTNKGKKLVSKWVAKASRQKLQQRLKKNGVDAKSLFEKYSNQHKLLDDIGIKKAMNEISNMFMKGCRKDMDEYVQNCIRQISGNMDFDTFSRLLADIVQEASIRSQEEANKKTVAIAEARALIESNENLHLFQFFERIEYKADKTSKVLKTMQLDLDRASSRVSNAKEKYLEDLLEMLKSKVQSKINATEDSIASTNDSLAKLRKLNIELRESSLTLKHHMSQPGQQLAAERDKRRDILQEECKVLEAKLEQLLSDRDNCLASVDSCLKIVDDVRKVSSSITTFKSRITSLSAQAVKSDKVVERIERIMHLLNSGFSVNSEGLDLQNIVSKFKQNVLNIENAFIEVDQIILDESNNNKKLIQHKKETIKQPASNNDTNRGEERDERDQESKEEPVSSPENTPRTPSSTPRKKRKKKKKDAKVLEEELCNAVKGEEMEKIIELLKDGVNPNSKDKNGSTGLMHAAWPGNIEVTKALLAHGADPLITNLRRNTPLHFAFERGHEDLARLLLENGSLPCLKMKNSLGKTPLALNKSFKPIVIEYTSED